jgi:hypothetical protein
MSKLFGLSVLCAVALQVNELTVDSVVGVLGK